MQSSSTRPASVRWLGPIAAVLAFLLQLALGGSMPGQEMGGSAAAGTTRALHICRAAQAGGSGQQPHEHGKCLPCPLCVLHGHALTLLAPAMLAYSPPVRMTGVTFQRQARAPPALWAKKTYPTGPPSPI